MYNYNCIKLIKITYIALYPLYIYFSPTCFVYSVPSSVVSIISYLTSRICRPNKCFDNYRYYKYRMCYIGRITSRSRNAQRNASSLYIWKKATRYRISTEPERCFFEFDIHALVGRVSNCFHFVP